MGEEQREEYIQWSGGNGMVVSLETGNNRVGRGEGCMGSESRGWLATLGGEWVAGGREGTRDSCGRVSRGRVS